MNIDEKIKKELENNANEIDKILASEDEGLISMMTMSFKGGMKNWFLLLNIISFLVTIILAWCAYKFFTVAQELQVFWGVLMIATFQLQISAKQWISNEMNRSSLLREIKRVELAVKELEEKLDKKILKTGK